MSHSSQISSVNKPADGNTGGYKQLLFRPVRDVADIPPANTEYNITDDITLKSGIEGFFEMYVTFKSANVAIEQSDSQQGPVVNVEITGIVPGDSNINQGVFNYMMFDRFIVIGKDNEEVQRVFGTLEKGMKFTWEFTTEEQPEGRRGYRITFSRSFSFAPYFYQSEVKVQQRDCPTDLQGYFKFEDGDDQVIFEADQFTAGTHTGVKDHNNVGTIGNVTYEIDDGTGYTTVTFPFTHNDGDLLRITRPSTSGIGYIVTEGSY